jgi:hypothetical protein
MRNTLTNDIDRAKYDTLVTKGGYKMANDWVRFSVMMYDLFRAQRADRGVADEDMPNGSQFMLRATMEVISEVLDLHISAQRRIMNDLEKQQVSFIFQQRNPQVFYGLRIAEQNLTPKGATSYEIPSDAKRLYEAAFVTIRVPDPDGGPARDLAFDGRLMEIALDAGPHVWVHASYADDMPPGAVQVGDGRSPGYSVSGERIISVPSDWCTFHTDEEATAIMQAQDADDKLLSYAR